MKNFIVTLSLIVVAGTTQSFATDANPGPASKETFAKKFAGAQHVKWTALESGFEKVAFTIGGTRAEAYFDSDGELLGTARNILYTQLPLSVMQTVANRFANAIVIETIEISNADGTSYRVVLEQKDKKITARIGYLGDVISIDKQKSGK